MIYTAWIVISLCGISQLIYWWRVIGRQEEVMSDLDYRPMVSVIVAYHNEADCISDCISALCEQSYEHLEIIAIDDHSTDSGSDQLRQLLNRFPRLKLLSNDGQQGKKHALSKAITSATGEWIALTDADCIPDDHGWISIAMSYARDQDILLGYSPYRRYPGWLNHLIRYETWLIALQYIGLLSHGMRYMAVGRNLFFRKSTYLDRGGYDDHMDIVGGMDDLFVHGIASDVRVTALTDLRTYVTSEPKRTIAGLYRQKARHLTTSTRYDTKTQLILSVISASHLGYYLAVVLFFCSGHLTIGLGLLMIRYFVIMWSQYRARRVLSSSISILHIPILDVMLMVYYISLSFTYLKPRRQW